MFISKRGGLIRGYTSDEFTSILAASEHYGVSTIQMAESASYSYAMVARSSLGLSCKDATITALVSDSLQGCVALGTLRHLINNGAAGKAFILGSSLESVGSDLASYIQPLINCGVVVQQCTGFADVTLLRTALEQCHFTLCGASSTTTVPTTLIRDITEVLNDVSTPIHSVLHPIGIHPDTGELNNPIYSATTLSLGVPLLGLEVAREVAGRHYVCDISIPRRVFDDRQEDCTELFSEQPITQLFIESEIKKPEKQ